MNNRYATRIEVPGTTIRYYNLSKKMFIPKAFAGESELINLSKSGACFYVNERLSFGEKLTMKFFFPDGNVFKLAGHVRWVKEAVSSISYNVGVLFSPFGIGKGYNPPSALDYFKKVHKLDKIVIEKNTDDQQSEEIN